MIAYPIASVATEYTVPSGVTYIDYGAFAIAIHLKRLFFRIHLFQLGSGICKVLKFKELSLPDI